MQDIQHSYLSALAKNPTFEIFEFLSVQELHQEVVHVNKDFKNRVVSFKRMVSDAEFTINQPILFKGFKIQELLGDAKNAAVEGLSALGSALSGLSQAYTLHEGQRLKKLKLVIGAQSANDVFLLEFHNKLETLKIDARAASLPKEILAYIAYKYLTPGVEDYKKVFDIIYNTNDATAQTSFTDLITGYKAKAQKVQLTELQLLLKGTDLGNIMKILEAYDAKIPKVHLATKESFDAKEFTPKGIITDLKLGGLLKCSLILDGEKANHLRKLSLGLDTITSDALIELFLNASKIRSVKLKKYLTATDFPIDTIVPILEIVPNKSDLTNFFLEFEVSKQDFQVEQIKQGTLVGHVKEIYQRKGSLENFTLYLPSKVVDYKAYKDLAQLAISSIKTDNTNLKVVNGVPIKSVLADSRLVNLVVPGGNNDNRVHQVTPFWQAVLEEKNHDVGTYYLGDPINGKKSKRSNGIQSEVLGGRAKVDFNRIADHVIWDIKSEEAPDALPSIDLTRIPLYQAVILFKLLKTNISLQKLKVPHALFFDSNDTFDEVVDLIKNSSHLTHFHVTLGASVLDQLQLPGKKPTHLEFEIISHEAPAEPLVWAKEAIIDAMFDGDVSMSSPKPFETLRNIFAKVNMKMTIKFAFADGH